MAVSIAASPNSLNTVDALRWRVTLTDLGTDPLIKRAGWILEDASGGVVAELSSTRPGSTSDPILLDFTRNIRGLVTTKLPAIGALGVQNDNTFIKEFKLKYGDIVINKDTGAVTNNVTNLTSAYKVFNGNNNIWDTALTTSAGAYILSYRPLNYNLVRTSQDYLWLLGSGTVVYRLYYSDNTTQDITQSAPYDANIIPVGLPFLAALMGGGHDSDDVTQLRITIGSVSYYIQFEHLCEGDQEGFMEVLFLEPLGGRSVMLFQTVEGAGVSRQTNEAEIYKNINSIAALRSAGDSIIYSKAHGTYQFKRQLGNDPDEIRWAHGFGAATEHHLLLKDRAGTQFWAKFLLDGPPSINLSSKEMTASGRLAKSIDAPYAF